MKTVFLEMERLRNLNSGLGQFCKNLGQALVQLADPDFSFSFYLPASCRGLFGSDRNYLVHSPVHKVLKACRERFDCWHCLHQDSPYLPSRGQAKLMLTIHDMNFMAKYAGLRRKLRCETLRKKIDRSTALVFPSRFSEKMVNNHFSCSGKITRIIPYGNCLERSETRGPSVAPPSGRFLFTIGAVLPKKNFHVLVPFLKKLKGYSLVIAGDDTTAYAGKIEDDAQYWGVDDRILFTGPIDDSEKFWWYRHCEAFVFPSLSEGFGLPVIEAMSLGKPVFISTLTSLPEVGGTEAFYWESFDPDAMAAVFEAGMNEYHRSAAKARSIAAWAATFSWENTARRYLDLYAVITR